MNRIVELARKWLSPLRLGTGPITIGTKAIVLDETNRVLLLRHTYSDGWQLPGGTVERGESVIGNIKRELYEETGLVIDGSPSELLGIFYNESENKSDHVAVFVVRKWQIGEGFRRNLEIREHRFFDLDNLPAGVTAGTERRIIELRDGLPLNERW